MDLLIDLRTRAPPKVRDSSVFLLGQQTLIHGCALPHGLGFPVCRSFSLAAVPVLGRPVGCRMWASHTGSAPAGDLLTRSAWLWGCGRARSGGSFPFTPGEQSSRISIVTTVHVPSEKRPQYILQGLGFSSKWPLDLEPANFQCHLERF